FVSSAGASFFFLPFLPFLCDFFFPALPVCCISPPAGWPAAPSWARLTEATPSDNSATSTKVITFFICHHLLSYAAPYSTAARRPKESAVIDLLHCSGAPAKLFTLRWAPAAVNQRRRVSRDDGRNPAVAALAYFAATAGSTSFANSCNE